jgi:hypothetical protein
MSDNPSRAVTRRKCVVCGSKFKASRRDAAYCSSACRQKAARSRSGVDEIDREIDEARRVYWALIRRKAEAEGKSESQILTVQSQFVDEHGNVYMGGGKMGGMGADAQLVGRVTPNRPGWSSWGLEAAGPPFSPPGSEIRGRGKRKKAGPA